MKLKTYPSIEGFADPVLLPSTASVRYDCLRCPGYFTIDSENPVAYAMALRQAKNHDEEHPVNDKNDSVTQRLQAQHDEQIKQQRNGLSEPTGELLRKAEYKSILKDLSIKRTEGPWPWQTPLPPEETAMAAYQRAEDEAIACVLKAQAEDYQRASDRIDKRWAARALEQRKLDNQVVHPTAVSRRHEPLLKAEARRVATLRLAREAMSCTPAELFAVLKRIIAENEES